MKQSTESLSIFTFESDDNAITPNNIINFKQYASRKSYQ